MKEFLLLSVGVGLGFWLRGRFDAEKKLKEENIILRNKLKPEENKGE
ncbi:hypothetical protein PA10_00100 [Pseudomonas phage pPa_SNUABM_DT01]|nr:hypothetical protein PA10_00100 [Pseudomonas phage pPa_SNUABM_DT01]